MHWVFYTLFAKFVVETFFFNKAHFSKVLCLLQQVSFSGKDSYVLRRIPLLATTGFTSFEINIGIH